MFDEVEHEDNATPTTTDDDIKRMDADTEQNANPGAAVDQQGVGNNPGESTDPDSADDPKSGGTPVHSAPTEDSPGS
jgi:hypothetical protein